MIKIEHTEVEGWKAAIRGMRNPHMSHSRSDSSFFRGRFVLGKNDYDLAMKLAKAGSEHRKFMRYINVSCDITAPVFFVQELDTYKIGTTRNSYSLQHKGTSQDYTIDDFTWDNETDAEYIDYAIDYAINKLNWYRYKYLETKDYKYFRLMRELLPMGYNYRFTWSANYEVLANIYRQRKNHSLEEWTQFIMWIRQLPYSELITIGDKDTDGDNIKQSENVSQERRYSRSGSAVRRLYQRAFVRLNRQGNR